VSLQGKGPKGPTPVELLRKSLRWEKNVIMPNGTPSPRNSGGGRGGGGRGRGPRYLGDRDSKSRESGGGMLGGPAGVKRKEKLREPNHPYGRGGEKCPIREKTPTRRQWTKGDRDGVIRAGRSTGEWKLGREERQFQTSGCSETNGKRAQLPRGQLRKWKVPAGKRTAQGCSWV